MSPAALEGMDEMSGAIEIAAEPEMAASAAKGTTAKRTPAPTPSPASPRGTPAWTRNESETDTGRVQSEQTPSASRRSAIDAPNPFSGGDLASELKNKPIPWAVVAAVVASIVAVLAIAALIITNS